MSTLEGSSIEAPGAGSVAWVAKGNKIIFDFVYLCPSAVPCGREWLVRPTTRELQKFHVAPDVPHDSPLFSPSGCERACCLLLAVLVGGGRLLWLSRWARASPLLAPDAHPRGL